ncbi:hypothetical protein [Xenorhabdus bovienii]|uniref:Uncharacterized protein n=1 Tax=Xenorhabdus bovienii str. Intermedium TaxID=1379677 RepID=A0A077QPV0_XENBV|nr:hypothetical protein [Xenorhabdus bovienii]CDH34516.1 hypothetical protein XBI1_3080090 [Xenorhabdus bovienii str. Intermedium]
MAGINYRLDLFDLESGKAIPIAQQQSTGLPQLSRLEVLQMAIESEQGRLEEKARADKAERTKSQISRSREAQVLSKLGAVTRKYRELEERLRESTKHATITAVQNTTEKNTSTPHSVNGAVKTTSKL